MSDGGFIYEKITITSNSSAYATNNDWCVFVHLKRCEAFLRATERESAHWTPIHTGETGEDASNVSYDDSNTVEVYKIKFSVSEDHPAYVSYFRNPKTLSEYAIITAAGLSFSSNSPSSAYINPARLNQIGYTTSQYYLAPSFAHSMVMKGSFASYDLKSSSVAKNEIPVTCQYGIYRATQGGGNTDGYSMVYNYTNSSFDNKTYSFGYAVKGDTIISIYSVEGGIPFWSIIGDIFDENAIGGNPYGVICNPNDANTSDSYTTISYQRWVDDQAPNLSVIDYKGDAYPNKTIHDSYASYITCRCMPSFICARTNATVPARLAYGALCCAFNTYYKNLEIPGIDESGNMMKGYVRTDVLRVVSHRLCANAGSIFQGGNFVSMSIGSSSNPGTLGILLGWDPSNGAL